MREALSGSRGAIEDVESEAKTKWMAQEAQGEGWNGGTTSTESLPKSNKATTYSGFGSYLIKNFPHCHEEVQIQGQYSHGD